MPTKSVLVRACPCPNKSASLDCQAAGMMDRIQVRQVSYILIKSDRFPIPPVMVPNPAGHGSHDRELFFGVF